MHYLKTNYLFIGCAESLLLCGLSLVVVSGGFSCCRAQVLGVSASVVVAHGPGCSMACGIFPDQGLNLCPLHWQVNAYALYYQCVCVLSSVRLCDPWTVTCQVPLSMQFSRQEHCSRLSFLLPGDLSDLGIVSYVSYIGRWILYQLYHLGSPEMHS